MIEFNAELFQSKVNDSLNTVKRILDLHRNPRLAEFTDHEYGDKYLLVEQMANIAVIAQLNVMTYFGLTAQILQSIDQSKPNTLRFQASTSCTFLKQEIVDVLSQRTEVEEQHVASSLFGSTSRSTIKQVVLEVPQYHWKVDVHWEVSLYSGSDVEGKTTLKQRSGSMDLIVQSKKEAPLPEHQEFKPIDLSLSLLLKFINTEKMTSGFAINRDAPTTKTPCQNEQVASIATMMKELEQWTKQVQGFFVANVLQVYKQNHNPAGTVPSLSSTGSQGDTWSLPVDQDIFVPILPVMETLQQPPQTASTEMSSDDDMSRSVLTLLVPPEVTESSLSLPSTTIILSSHDMQTVLNEQVRSMEEWIASLCNMYPSSESMTAWSVEEIILVVLCPYSKTIGERYTDAVNYVECMLRKQLVAAIGKHIKLSDIEQFVRYHNARLLNPAPKSFCHAIRLLGHDPYGLLSIESIDADGSRTPIQTLCREIESSSGSTVKVPLNSATMVEVSGKKYLHGWIHHRFGRQQRLKLISRARQFSAFVLVVGTMSGSDCLEPKDAIIVQNKDEVLIPLILEEIPTSREFKDATKSLSPEQQRFAKAFRSMQLASSVMGICVIQIKPQLEVLLGLGEGALTKEMQLTQDLLELFIEYQIPSDLLSYDGNDPGASRNEKVANVRGHVKTVLDVIDTTKDKALQDKLNTELVEQSKEVESVSDNTGLESEVEIIVRPDGTKVRRTRRSRAPNSNEKANCQIGDAHLTGEIYVRSDGKKVRRVKKMCCTSQVSYLSSIASEMVIDQTGDARVPAESEGEIIVDPGGVRGGRGSTFADGTVISRSGDAYVPGDSFENNDVDVTKLPKQLDAAIEAFSPNLALRSTTLKVHNRWKRIRQKDLLSKPVPTWPHRKTETNKAFDLLDAISRSGSLPIAFSELHVMVAVTHSFEKDVMETIVQDNINPIEKLEISTLLVGSLIHGVPVSALVRGLNKVDYLQHFQ